MPGEHVPARRGANLKSSVGSNCEPWRLVPPSRLEYLSPQCERLHMDICAKRVKPNSLLYSVSHLLLNSEVPTRNHDVISTSMEGTASTPYT
jgi:hypothetical protein